MGLMTSEDWAAMNADLMAIRGDNPVSIEIRRGSSTLAAQTVRVAGRKFRADTFDSAGGEQVVGTATLLGDTTLDIQVADRFSVDGVLYEVHFIEGNRVAGVRAQLKVIE